MEHKRGEDGGGARIPAISARLWLCHGKKTHAASEPDERKGKVNVSIRPEGRHIHGLTEMQGRECECYQSRGHFIHGLSESLVTRGHISEELFFGEVEANQLQLQFILPLFWLP